MSNENIGLIILTGGFGTHLNAANTGAGVKNPDGSFNTTGTVIGIAQTTHSVVEFATIGSSVAKYMPQAGGLLGALGAWDSGRKIYEAKEKGTSIQQSDIAGVIGGVASLIGAGAALITMSGAVIPLVVTVGTIATVVGVGASAYQLVAGAAGWKIDADRNVTPLPVTDDGGRNIVKSGDRATDQITKSVVKAIDALTKAGMETDTIAEIIGQAITQHAGESGAGIFGTPLDLDRNHDDAMGQIYDRWAASSNIIPRRDPLILDLDGDGIETIARSANVHFDHDLNGFAEQSGWVGGDDALLVRDLDGDGKITSGAELFGDHTRLGNGAFAANGFAALADLDSNQDGVLDDNDKAFASLRVWQDRNGNGITDAGELSDLGAAGVKTLNVHFSHTNKTDAAGNALRQLGSYVATDGSTRSLGDVWFATNTMRSVALTEVTLSEAIAQLPELPGMGNILSLRQAMAQEASGLLQRRVESIMSMSDPTARRAAFDDLLLNWSGGDRRAANSRGNFINGRILYALESLTGMAWPGGGNPINEATALSILAIWRDLGERLYLRWEVQTTYKEDFSQFGLAWNISEKSLVPDAMPLVASLKQAMQSAPESTSLHLLGLGETLRQLGDSGRLYLDALHRAGQQDASELGKLLVSTGKPGALIRGTNGDDTLSGDGSSNYMLGGDGNDRLYGDAGNDTLVGGKGNDYLNGGIGNDIYVFNQGDGTNTISDYDYTVGNIDTLRLGQGINAENTVLARSGTLSSGNGNDWLYGDYGDDTLSGGTGNDRLNGSYGSDTYVFNQGDGVDTIGDYDYNPANIDTLKFGAGITSKRLSFSHVGNNLEISVGGTGDKTIIENWYLGSAYQVERISTADNVTILNTDLERLIQPVSSVSTLSFSTAVLAA
ncbi:calcium-binding protein [Herbaspirillum sp.]|uniref:calcium-binding protein n=1 Tax=Herbaspirillum sp. TaxID=1890675 RepID=UPI0031D96138